MRIALLGTGLLGGAMAERLLDLRNRLTVYNRTREKTLLLENKGARVVSSASEAVAGVDCVILMLSDASAIAEVLLDEACATHLAGKIVLQMGTIAPAESVNLAQSVEGFGGGYAEAPVLGSVSEAKSGKLIVMFGGSDELFARSRGVLSAFAGELVRVGCIGKAAAVKLALNQLIAALTAGFSLSLGLIEKEGIDVERFMEILRGSALYAPTFDKKLHRMVERDFSRPNFPTKHLAKDVALFLKEADRLGLDDSALRGIHRILDKAIASGAGEEDYSALHNTISPSR
ncbi:MAG: NAD(P)-dependent oxidoreductase [Pseudomonadota bacterium]